MKEAYRHEYKYIISEASALLLRCRLPSLMAPDPHAGPEGKYTIRSLYFDDFSYTAYADKMSGIRDREKYRIRIYNHSDSIIKLERKEKHGHLTRKTAQRISPEEALSLEKCLAEGPYDESLVSCLRLGIKTQGLRPRVLVDYDRSPFVCPSGNTRITIDENLRTRPYCATLFSSHEAMQRVLEPGQVILEVKFDDFLPSHLHDALKDVPRVPMAVSKFALCLSLT